MKPKHISPVDWYLVSAWLKFDCTDKQNHAYQDIWENTYLVKANSPMVAFDKGVKFAQADEENIERKGKQGRWTYAGIKEVLPIYEELQDGAELFWSDLGRRENSEIDRKILSKEKYQEQLKE